MSLLEVADLTAGYGAIRAIDALAMRVERGEIVTLIGGNGAGKSTTLNTICGLVRAWSGTIRFDGTVITNRPAYEIVRHGIAQSPEGRKVFARLTIAENLDLGAYARRDRAGVAADLKRVLELFPRLAERLGQLAGTLSGGEQQMLAIARALMARPTLLLLDEPSMGLAPILVQQIFAILAEIRSQGTTILLVEQNANAALGLADRAYVLQSGRLVNEGSAAMLRSDPAIRAAYLGG